MDDCLDLLATIHDNRCNADILTGYDDTGTFKLGIRVRPWKQQAGKGTMVLATATTLEGALVNAIKLCEAGRWDRLDFAARPWRQRVTVAGWGTE